MTASEPIRADWLDRRAAFFRERAAELFPSSPVASTFEHRLRADYLDHCARTAALVDPADFANFAAANRERSLARYGFFIGGLIGAVAGFFIGGWVGAVVLTVIGAVAAMYVGWGLGALNREVFLARVASVAADRAAYRAWRTAAHTAAAEPVSSPFGSMTS